MVYDKKIYRFVSFNIYFISDVYLFLLPEKTPNNVKWLCLKNILANEIKRFGFVTKCTFMQIRTISFIFLC